MLPVSDSNLYCACALQDKIPIIGGLIELIGIGVTGW
jgi:hypothetical protein